MSLTLKLLFAFALLVLMTPAAPAQIYLDIPGFGGGGGLFGGQDRRYDRRYDRHDRRYDRRYDRGLHRGHGGYGGPNYLYQDPNQNYRR